jgi:hypothetical protein
MALDEIPLPIITQCCVCRDYKVRGGYTTLSPAFDAIIQDYYRVSHTYCNKCLEVELKNVESTTGTPKTIEEKI